MKTFADDTVICKICASVTGPPSRSVRLQEERQTLLRENMKFSWCDQSRCRGSEIVDLWLLLRGTAERGGQNVEGKWVFDGINAGVCSFAS